MSTLTEVTVFEVDRWCWHGEAVPTIGNTTPLEPFQVEISNIADDSGFRPPVDVVEQLADAVENAAFTTLYRRGLPTGNPQDYRTDFGRSPAVREGARGNAHWTYKQRTGVLSVSDDVRLATFRVRPAA